MNQYMTFTPLDNGPSYVIKSEEREEQYVLIHKNKRQIRSFTRSQFIENLENARKIDPIGNKEKLQQLSLKFGLPIQVEKEVILKGWLGKAKGAFQVLFERGWINPVNSIHCYTGYGKKDSNEDGNADVTGRRYLLKALMKKQAE